MTPDELKVIKERWSEKNRYGMLEKLHFEIFDAAQKDISYLVNRLEAAEKAARGFAEMTKKFKIIKNNACSYPRHAEIQQIHKHNCPECGDDSMIPGKDKENDNTTS